MGFSLFALVNNPLWGYPPWLWVSMKRWFWPSPWPSPYASLAGACLSSWEEYLAKVGGLSATDKISGKDSYGDIFWKTNLAWKSNQRSREECAFIVFDAQVIVQFQIELLGDFTARNGHSSWHITHLQTTDVMHWHGTITTGKPWFFWMVPMVLWRWHWHILVYPTIVGNTTGNSGIYPHAWKLCFVVSLSQFFHLY